MKFTSSLLGVAGIATAILLDAAPSKAVLYIDFIPLSPTKTRIKVAGTSTINPSKLATTPAPVAATVSYATSGGNTSAINKGSDGLRLTYGSPSASMAGFRYKLIGPSNPFAGGGNFAWTGPSTPSNNPPFELRFASGFMDFWLPNTFTGGATPVNLAKPMSGFFDVNLSLAQIGVNGAVAFTSGSEQVILRNATDIPGPVPILGAAAAFGYSRKLRNRIQKSTSLRTA
jgi:hypothetical protein